MTSNTDMLSRHPLHLSVLESFAELRATPEEQLASFTATISRILTEAFVKQDAGHVMPSFLTDQGVVILRYGIEIMEEDRVPGSKQSIGAMISAWHDTHAEDPSGQAIVTSGRFALCAPFATLPEMLMDPTLSAGGTLGFFDPIYEDSLILIYIEPASRARWLGASNPAPQKHAA